MVHQYRQFAIIVIYITQTEHFFLIKQRIVSLFKFVSMMYEKEDSLTPQDQDNEINEAKQLRHSALFREVKVVHQKNLSVKQLSVSHAFGSDRDSRNDNVSLSQKSDRVNISKERTFQQYQVTSRLRSIWSFKRCDRFISSFINLALHRFFELGVVGSFFMLAIGYVLLVLLVSMTLYRFGVQHHPECLGLTNKGESIDEYSDNNIYYATFSLTWTTLSTVGYGKVHPWALEGFDEQCWRAEAACFLASFIGILYASFCGAVFYAKVGRVSTMAEVLFSDSICISYGYRDGNMSSGKIPVQNFDSNLDTRLCGSKMQNLECPLLMFRIANKVSEFVTPFY